MSLRSLFEFGHLRTEHRSNDKKKPVQSVLFGPRFERGGRRGPSMTSRKVSSQLPQMLSHETSEVQL